MTAPPTRTLRRDISLTWLVFGSGTSGFLIDRIRAVTSFLFSFPEIYDFVVDGSQFQLREICCAFKLLRHDRFSIYSWARMRPCWTHPALLERAGYADIILATASLKPFTKALQPSIPPSAAKRCGLAFSTTTSATPGDRGVRIAAPRSAEFESSAYLKSVQSSASWIPEPVNPLWLMQLLGHFQFIGKIELRPFGIAQF